MAEFSLWQKVRKQWQLLLFVIVFLPLLLHLGFWQLDRAEDKRQSLAVYQQQQTLPPVTFEQLLEKYTYSGDAHYRSVVLDGQYDKQRYWLLDNRSRAGQSGYEIVMPLWLGTQWVLVNRGWVAAPPTRAVLPVFATPDNKNRVTGYFYAPSKNAIVDTNQSDLIQEWPKRVLQLDVGAMRDALGNEHPMYPKVLRIDDDSAGAFTTEWPVVNTLPEKHQAYAVQWFSMAVVLLLLYVWALFKASD